MLPANNSSSSNKERDLLQEENETEESIYQISLINLPTRTLLLPANDSLSSNKETDQTQGDIAIDPLLQKEQSKKENPGKQTNFQQGLTNQTSILNSHFATLPVSQEILVQLSLILEETKSQILPSGLLSSSDDAFNKNTDAPSKRSTTEFNDNVQRTHFHENSIKYTYEELKHCTFS